MAKKLSELDEAFAAGASVDAYPPQLVARMAAAPANVNYVKRQMPAPEAPTPAPAPSNSGERLRQVQNIANAGANPQAFIQRQAVPQPKSPRQMQRQAPAEVPANFASDPARLRQVQNIAFAGANPQAFLNQEAPKVPRGRPDPNVSADTTKIVDKMRVGKLGASLLNRYYGSTIGQEPPKAPREQNATYVPPTPGLTDEERAEIAAQETAQKYLSERKPLAAGVTRYDAGLDTPANVYATVDKNGNRVYTDNPNYAASVTDGVGRMPQNEQTKLRAGDLAADTNRNFEYTAPITDLAGIAELRRNLPNMPAGTKAAIEAALPEAERAANIEAARTGSRPVDLRRRAEGADLTAGKNLYRPPGAGDAKGALTPYQMLQTQLGMMDRQDRAENTAYTRSRDAEEDKRRQTQDAAAATKAEQERRDKDLSTVFEVQKRLSEVTDEDFKKYRTDDLLAPIMTMIPEDDAAAQDFLANNPAGQQIAKMYDQILQRQVRGQGGYTSFLDDDVNVTAGDLQFRNPDDESSALYFQEPDEGWFGVGGEASLGTIAQQAERLGTTPNRISALYKSAQTKRQRTERK